MAKSDIRTHWESPKLVFEGKLDEIVLGGVGKSTVLPKDPGEANKVQT